MLQFGFFNVLDLLLIFILFIGLLTGFVRGAVPQLVSAVSIWFGLLCALWLYKPFSIRILQGVGFGRTSGDTIAFLILLIVMFHTVRLIVKSLTTSPERRKKKKKDKDDPLSEAPKSAKERFITGPLNAIGGMIMGIVLTVLWGSLILGILQFALQVEVSTVPGVQVSEVGLTGQLRGSALVPYFNRVLWLFVQSTEPFVSANADILKQVVAKLFERVAQP